VDEKLVLAAEAGELSRARRWVEQVLGDHSRMDPSESAGVVLAVNEALANAIEHGEPSSAGTVELRCQLQPESIVFEVEDFGHFTMAPRERDPIAERGRGIPLMNLLMDEVSMKTSNDGTLVRLVKHVPLAPANGTQLAA
jgi:anti-sigma regulatory factor (Ser/Thr protein kinase)